MRTGGHKPAMGQRDAQPIENDIRGCDAGVALRSGAEAPARVIRHSQE